MGQHAGSHRRLIRIADAHNKSDFGHRIQITAPFVGASAGFYAKKVM
jgi:hypothetical protein